MRGLLLCFLLSLVYFNARADRYYSPQTSSSISGSTSYCQNASASAITFTYNSCVSGAGGVAYGSSMTVYWYRNTINSTTGGTLVSTTSATSAAAATGSVTYTPATTSAGTFYYYCIISYTATGTCGTGGTLTSGTAQVTVIAPPGPITGTLTVAPSASVTLSDSASGGTWSTSAASIATINAATGVVTGVANGSAVISYTTGCGTAVAATVTVMPSVTWYQDAEGDGWGNPLIYQTVAGKPSGYVQNKQDINDNNVNTSAWYNIGSAGFAFNGGSVNTTNHKIVFDNNGVPYVYYLLNTSNSWVQKYSGGAWTVVGGTSFTGNVSYASMAMSSTNVPYVAYQDGYNASCKKFDGSSWVQVGSANFTANGATYEALALDNSDVPYMAYRDNNVSNKASVMKFNGTSWVQVGSAGFSAGAAAYTAIAIDLYNNIYVAYQDGNSSSKVTVMKYNGSSWSVVGSAGFSAGTATYVSIAVDRSGTPYVAYNDAGNSNKASVMKFNGSSWVTVGSAGFSAGTANYTDIKIDAAGTPYVSYSDASLSNKAVVMKFNGTSWAAVVSSTGFTSGAAPYVAMALNKEGVPAVFFQDGANSNKGSAMYLAPVKVMPTQPVITASPSSSCGSTTVSLTVSSGTLNDATSWVWYKGSCGGTYVGTGSTITLSVSSTTNFYCRGENNYFTTQGDCGYAKVSVKTTPTWYQDADGDGWGNASVSLSQCSQPTGYVLNSSDCTDGSTTNTVAYSYGSAGISSSTATYTNLLFDNSNTPYIYFLNNGTSSSVYKYNSGTWTAVGSTGFTGNVSYGSMAINSTGNLYVAYQDGYQASCKRFNGTDWEQVGSANFSSGGATYTSLAIDNSDVPYVAFVENYYMWTNKASVMKYNGASWSYVGGGGITSNTANYTSLAVDAGGALYLAYQDGSSNKATVMKYASGAWSVLGSANFSDGNATNIAIAVDDNGTPYVVYSDASYSGKAIVKKYNGSSWVNVGASSGISSGSTSYTSIKLDAGGNPYISYTDAGISSKASVMKFNGTSWVSVSTSAGFTPGTSSHSSLAIDAYGIPYLSVQDASTSNKATVYKAAPVSVNPTTPTVSASSTSISCGATVTLTVSGTLNNATAWRWYTDTSGSGTTIGSGATFTVSPTATGTRYYVRGEGPCLTNQGSFAGSPAITVTGGITGPTDISGTSPICRAATATYTSSASGTGVTTAWSSSNTSVASVNASTGVVTGISAGTATITFTASSAGCGSTYKTKSVTVVRTPSVITGTQAVCVGGLTALSDSVSGGTWSSSNTGVATITSSTGVVSGASAGTTNISYSVTNACGTNAVGLVVTVNAAPTVASITANPTNYCMGAGGAVTLTAGTVTGTGTLTSYNWSGPLGYSTTSTTSSTSFTPTNSLSSGYYQLSVTYPGSGCTSSSVTSDYVTISPNPTIYTVTGGTGCSYPGVTVGLSGSQTGISYQLYRGSVAVGSPIAGTGAALSFGTQTVAGTYSVTGTGTSVCVATMSGTATVITAPAFYSLSGGTACASTGVTISLSGSQSGISYQLYRDASTVGSSVAGTGSALSFGFQNTVGSYYVVATGTGGCSDTQLLRANVVSSIPAYNVTGGTGCTSTLGTTVGLDNSQAGVTYQLYNGAYTAGSPVNGTGGAISFGLQTTAGTYTVTASTTGCTNQAMTGSATVYTSPSTFTVMGGTGCPAPGVTVTLSSSASGVSYQLYNGAATVGSPVAGTGSSISFGTQTTMGVYKVVGTGTGGCAVTMSDSVTVTGGPAAPAAITGTFTTCQGGSVTLSDATAGGTWSSANSAIATVSPTGVVTGTGAGTVNISYTVSNGCGSSSAIAAVTINAGPAITPSSAVSLCSGGSATLTISGATSYSWAPNTNLSSTVGASVVASPTSSVTYTVTGTTSGCSSTATIPVTVNPTPTVASITANTYALCFGTTLTLTAGSTTGTGSLVSYNWRGPNSYSTSGTINTAGIATSSTLQSGNYSVSVTYPGSGCTSAFAVTSPSVTVAMKPTVSSLNATAYTVCSGSTVTLIANSTTGGAGSLVSYNWSGPNAYSATSTATSISLSPASSAASGNYSVYAIYSGTGCTGPVVASPVITVNNTPTITATGGGTMCTGSSVTMAASGGTTYTWTPATGLSSTTAASVTATPSSTTVYTVTGTTSGCSSTSTATVTVNALPTVASLTTNSSALCYGATLTLTAGSTTGTGSLTSYNWRGPNSYSTSGTTATTGITASTTAQSGNYSVSVTYPGNGCTSAFAVTSPSVTVAALPTVASLVANTYTVCTGTAITLTAGAASGGTGTLTSYNWSGPGAYSATGAVNTNSFTPLTTASAGAYSVSVTYSGTGCTSNNVASPTVNVRDLPTVASVTASSSTLCYGASLSLTAGTATGTGTLTSYNWRGPNSYSTSGTSNIATTTVNTTSASGFYSVSVTYPGTGCTSAYAVTSPSVTVNALPTVSGITASTACVGSALTLTAGTASGSGSLVSYNWSGPNSYSVTSTASPVSFTPTTTASGGVYTLSVTYPGTGCKSANVVTSPSVTVNAAPVAGTISGSATLLAGTTSTLAVTGASGGTGVWSSDNLSIATVTTSGTTTTVSAVSQGSANISYTVTNACSASASTGYAVSVQAQPTISSIAPAIAIPGTTITITGTNFNATATNNIVYFGAVRATSVIGSSTNLSVVVPVGATNQPVTVLNSAIGLAAQASSPFLPIFDTTGFINDSINFKSAVNYNSVSTAGHPYGGAIGDIDGDGKPDLVVNNRDSNTVSVFLNTGTGTTIDASTFTLNRKLTTLGLPNNVKLADIDGDGKLDIVCAMAGANFMCVFRNTTSTAGTSSFASRTDVTVGTVSSVAAVNDLNGDGKPDVALTLPGASAIGVLRNTSTVGTISFASIIGVTVGSAPTGVAVADLDGDGKADIAAANSGFTGSAYTGNTISIAKNTSTLSTISFGTSVSLSAGSGPIDIAAADITGDGKADLLVTNANDGNFSVFRNTASSGSLTTGSFAARVNFASGSLATGVAAADINGDTKIDVVVSNLGGTVSVFRNTTSSATPSFATRVDLTDGNGPTTVTIGDLDADKYPDVVVGNQLGNTISVFQNYPLPKVAPITGTSSVCASGGTTTLSNATPGGYWSMAGSNATINASGVVTGVTAGVDTALYTVVLGYDSNTARLPITINALPSVTLGATPAICEDMTTGTITYSGTTGSPNSYSIVWDAAAITAGFANVGATALTPGTISFAVPAGLSGTYNGTITVNNGCASSGSSFSVDIYTHPVAAITSAPVPCTGYATTITVTGSADATIAYNVDGGSTLHGTLTGGTYAISTGMLSAPHAYRLISVSNAGCTTNVDTTTIISPVILQWVGGAPSYLNDWNTPANWGCGIVPSVTDNIIIPAGVSYVPVISGTAYTNSITLQAGASVTVSSGAVLNVKGTLTNNGTILGGGKTMLNGNVAQSIKGAGFVTNLEISNTNGVRIDSGALVSVGNTLTLSAGTLTTSDSLRLYSDSTVTARIAPIAVGASVSGKVKVMQYITGGYRRFRFWSHPFADTISLSQVQTYIDVTGAGGAASGFTPTITNAPSAFRYDPLVSNSTASYDPGWKPFTKINASAADTNKLHPGQGIRLFVRGSKGEGLGWLGYYGMYTPSPANITMAGKINQGNVSIALKQGSADPSLQDYNMVGNPYPSPVDIGTVVYNAKVANQVVGSAFYVFDPKLGAGGQYIAVPIGSGAAAPYSMQANTCFQVRAHHNGATLSFTEANKTASANSFLFKAPADYVTLNVYDQQYHLWDKLDIQFNNNAADAEDADYDAAKILSTDFTFYSIAADGRKLAIDARPFNKDKVIPLGVASSYEQTFIVRAENVAVPAGEAVYLHDKLLDKYVAMNVGSEYQFTIGKDAATQGDNRFELALKPAESKTTAGLSVTVTPNPATDNVGISFTSGSDDAVNINIADVSGVNVYSNQVAVGKNGVVSVPLSNLASGIYLIEVTQGNNKVTRRLVKE